MTSAERLTGCQWMYQGHSSEIIALVNGGQFIAMPAYSHRVSQTTNQGISLHHVTAMDNGTYIVMVTATDSQGLPLVLKHQAELNVIDQGTLAGEGQLQVTQQQTPHYNTTTQQWSVELTCGQILCPLSSGHGVEWTLPSGHTRQSSSFQGGFYRLVLDNPVEGGTFTCTVAGLARDHSTRHATVTVDGVQARLAILEAEKARIMTDTSELLDNVQPLVHHDTDMLKTVAKAAAIIGVNASCIGPSCAVSLSSLLSEIIHTLDNNIGFTESMLIRQDVQLLQDVEGLRREMETLKEIQAKATDPENLAQVLCDLLNNPKFQFMVNLLQNLLMSGAVEPTTTTTQRTTARLNAGLFNKIGFHARQTMFDTVYQAEQTIVFDTVSFQVGGGYDQRTGVFTTPSDGLYVIFFNAYTARGSPREVNTVAKLVVRGRAIATSHSTFSRSTDYKSASVHAVYGLNKGDTVLVQNLYDDSSWYSGTFSIARVD